MLQTVKHPSELVHRVAAGWAWRLTALAHSSTRVLDQVQGLPLQVLMGVQMVALTMAQEPAVV